MKTILRTNGTKSMLFQFVESIEIIKNEDIHKYSSEYLKGSYDLAKSGDLCKVTWDHYEYENILLECNYNNLAVDCEYKNSIQDHEFKQFKKSFALIDRINKKFDYRLKLEDEDQLLKLIKLFNVQAVFYVSDTLKKTIVKSEIKNHTTLLLSEIKQFNQQNN
jgi:hypothetical protein